MAAKEFSSAVDVIKTDGATEVVGTPSVTVLHVDSAFNVLLAKGATVPTDADAGYAKGCLFIKTNGSTATTLYINEGSETSSDFNAVESSASTITGVTAGSGLTGGGTEGTVTVALASDITQNQTISGTTVIIGRTAGTVAIKSAVVPNDTAGGAIKVSGTGTAFAVTPTNLTNFIDFSAADGVVSAAGTASVTHKIKVNIAGVGVRYIHLNSQ